MDDKKIDMHNRAQEALTFLRNQASNVEGVTRSQVSILRYVEASSLPILQAAMSTNGKEVTGRELNNYLKGQKQYWEIHTELPQKLQDEVGHIRAFITQHCGDLIAAAQIELESTSDKLGR